MKFISVIFVLASFIVIAGVASVCAADLRTEEVGPANIKGTFDLILYGGRYFRDVETAAFLDIEGDLYRLEPYAPDFDYRIIRGLSAKEALERAEQFVSGRYDFWRSLLSRIIDEQGKTVGYEVRPLYHVPAFGVPDVMNIDYVTKGDKIRIYIRLKPEVERQLFSGEGSKDRGH
jgi:hypothetical protein